MTMAKENDEAVEIIEEPGQAPVQQQAVPQQPAPQMNVMGCPGDCNRCTPMHRSYCASQIAYNMQNAVARIESAVMGLSQMLNSVGARVANIELQIEAQRQKEAQQTEFTAPEPAKPKKGKSVSS